MKTIPSNPETSREYVWTQLQEMQRTEMKQLNEEQKTLQHKKDNMNALAAANSKNGDDDIVEINVGGQLFLQVLRSTLCLPSDTMFSFMFSGRCEGSLIRDKQGRIFLDHDPELVEVIVNFLRMRKIEQGPNVLHNRRKSSKSKLMVRSPRIPEGKKEDFMSLLDHFELTEFFYPSPLSDVKVSPPVTKPSSLDITKIEVVQPDDSSVNVVKSENNIGISYNESNGDHNFVACTPSLDSSGEGSLWKVTIDSLPTDNWIYIGIIGDINADNNSFRDSTSYGWAGNSQVYKGGSNQSGASGWTSFVEGECLYFHLKENKLTMFSVQKKRAFVLSGWGWDLLAKSLMLETIFRVG